MFATSGLRLPGARMVIYTADVPFGRSGQQANIVIRDDRGVAAVELTPPESVHDAEQAESLLRDAGWRPTGAGSATRQGWAFPVARDPGAFP